MDYLCLLDESESGSAVPDPFFVYGALLVPVAQVKSLHERVMTIRGAAGLPDDVALKWNMATPEGVSRNRLAAAKRDILAAAASARAELFVSIVHRDIAAGKRSGGDMHLYGANTVLPAVGATLSERDAMAFFLIDRLPVTPLNTAFGYLGKRMRHGLGRIDQAASLPHASGFGFIDCHSVRIASALDISLGAFTRCLNERGTDLVDTVASAVVPILAKDGNGRVWERGVRLRPIIVRIADYAPSYTRVRGRLTELGLGMP
jgi:hypothetical protein